MTRIAQISDLHVGAGWFARDPLATLQAVLEAIAGLPDPVDGLIISGDLAADGRPGRYAALRPVLQALPWPVCVIPGNHDDRAAMRSGLGLGPAGSGSALHTTVRWAGLTVVALDTLVPGEVGGALGADGLAWLLETLREASPDPILIATHHPPFSCGVRAMDAIGLAAADRDALAELAAGDPRIRGFCAGHFHRAISGVVGGRPASVVPGTYAQFPLTFAADLHAVAEPIGFAVHALVDGRLVTHQQALALTAEG